MSTLKNLPEIKNMNAPLNFKINELVKGLDKDDSKLIQKERERAKKIKTKNNASYNTPHFLFISTQGTE